MLRGVMTVKEACELWGVEYQALKAALLGRGDRPSKFTEDEVAKSSSHWLITEEGMTRVYGERKK